MNRPWIKAIYPRGNMSSNRTERPPTTPLSPKPCRQKSSVSRITNHISWKDMLPSPSPNLNMLDYNVWSVLKGEIQTSFHPSQKSFKIHIVMLLDAMGEVYIKTSKVFGSRMEVVIAANVGYIE